MRLHPLAADGLIAAALTTVAVLLGTEAVAQGWPALDPLAWTLVALLTLPLVLRTRAPVTVCLAVHACWALYITLDYWPVVGSFGPMLAVYTVAAQRPTRIAAACAALLAGVWIYAGLRSDSGAMASVAGQAVGFPLVLWRFGYVARQTGELTLRLRAEQADRARREVAEERVRIARELHDVVAHHIAVINVQAGLARFVFRSDARTARDALDTIEGASGEALAELRRMLGLLRADGVQGADGAPAPGLDQLDEMVTRVRTGGVGVRLRVTGTPRPLPPGVQLCVYRVVQEALTNVLKHAPGADAAVELAYRAGEVTVSVTDDGPAGGPDPDTPAEGGGHGLIGMRERAKLYGGTIAVGPRSEGGFGVRLTLPTPVQVARRGDSVRE
ncbi:sensor histidine kinase [Streptomyces rubrogriseus]|uniref:sensor histidine kinase n=1 Tax=Streptomyces rubrogriseus TaxID=194673 RepID=UPI000D58EB5E|nr:sensor histidine kinase [Streptomyces rubrogriseus]